MDVNNGKRNTLLLTVIAVATLLVAVIGATFAYFTATIGDTETASTVEVTGATLTVGYAGNSSQINVTSTEPVPNAIGTKSFTVTGNNSTTNMSMPYTLYLVVTKNEFVLANTTTTTSLSYKITSATGTGVVPTSNSYGAIPTSMTFTGANNNTYTYGDNKSSTYTGCEVCDSLSRATLQSLTIDDGAGHVSNVSGVKLGVGYFGPTSTDVHHSYTISLYFLEDNKNQDEDKGKAFTGYITVGAGTQAIASSVTAVNCADSAC